MTLVTHEPNRTEPLISRSDDPACAIPRGKKSFRHPDDDIPRCCWCEVEPTQTTNKKIRNECSAVPSSRRSGEPSPDSAAAPVFFIAFVRPAVPSVSVSRSIATGPRRVFSIIASAPVGVHQNLHFTRLPVVFFLVAIFLVKVLELGHMSHIISAYFCLVNMD